MLHLNIPTELEVTNNPVVITTVPCECALRSALNVAVREISHFRRIVQNKVLDIEAEYVMNHIASTWSMASSAEFHSKSNASTESTLVQPCSAGRVEAVQTGSTNGATFTARSAYWTLIQNTKTPEFSGFAKNLREQDAAAREKGRAAAIQYFPDGRTSKTTFSTSQSLEAYLASALNSELDGEILSCQKRQPLRRLVILEDLPRNYIEVLGSQLRIHPAFFASHWADPITNRVSGRGFILNQSSRDSFVLQSPQMHCIDIEDQEEGGGATLYQLNAHVHRSVMKGPEQSDEDLASCFGELWNVVSFWSVKLEQGDWIALVLTDPPLGENVRHSTTKKLHKVSIREGSEDNVLWMQYPSLTARIELSDNIESWSTPYPSPSMLSTFDELLSVYSLNLHYVTDDPTSCTTVFRQIMLSMWIGFLDRIKAVLSNTHRQLWTGSGENHPNSGYEWQDWLFMDLVGLKIDVEYFLIFLYRNMKALGIKINGASRYGVVDEWEAEEWKFVETRLISFKQTVGSTADIYIQAISVEEARSSNAQAHSVALLTALATVFVPLSIVATIFSMGGDYAVGGTRFWVFFVTTIPIIISISVLLFTNVAANARNYFNGYFSSLRGTIKRAYSHPRSKGTFHQGRESLLPLFYKKRS